MDFRWLTRLGLRRLHAAEVDKYPAPDGNFQPTISDFLKSHVVLGNLVTVVISFLLPKPYDVIIAIIATGTIVDVWVHRFAH